MIRTRQVHVDDARAVAANKDLFNSASAAAAAGGAKK
jgi:hypothetical protein